MTTLPQVTKAMQTVLSDIANQAARATGFIQRQRAFSGAQWVQTLVFGWLDKPQATYEELVETAADLDVIITPQGLADRFTPAATACMQQVLQAAVQQVIAADPVAIPLLERFAAVYVQDSTTITLPDALAEQWAGCGGSKGRVAAALKAQLRLELRTGQLTGPVLQPGRTSDRAQSLVDRPLVQSVMLRDLGYWRLDDLVQDQSEQRWWLSRLYPGTAVFTADGQRHELLTLLAAQQGPQVELAVQLGAEHRLPCRLLALRVPQEVADQRRRRLTKEARDKGRTVSAERLALCDWTLLVTNVAVEQLTLAEALVLLRLRWQIELLFKLWKSQGQIDESRGLKPERVLCEVYAKLVAMVVQHWLLLTALWQEPDRSLPKAAKVVRRAAGRLARALHSGGLAAVVEQLVQQLQRTRRQTKRRGKPTAYQLALDPALLGLT